MRRSECTRCEQVEHKDKFTGACGGQAESVLWIVDRPRKWALCEFTETVMHGNRLILHGLPVVERVCDHPSSRA